MLPRTRLVVPVTERHHHQGPATAAVTLVQYGQLGHNGRSTVYSKSVCSEDVICLSDHYTVSRDLHCFSSEIL